MLTWYSLVAPVDPPLPPVAVTVPELYPAQIAVPFAGEAELSVGLAGAEATGQVHRVVQAVLPQEAGLPAERLACTITFPVAPTVFMAAPLV